LFKILIEEMEKRDLISSKIILKPLTFEHTCQLIMDSFNCLKPTAMPLAELAQKKTSGNPFFLGQFLKTITQEKLVTFNYKTRGWEWSIEQLTKVQYLLKFADVREFL
jgi:predicted ATPase